MSNKQWQLVTPYGACSSNEGDATETTDWSQCIFCQDSTSEKLSCPAESKRKDVGAGYFTIADNIKRFEELGSLPMRMDTARLDEGNGIGDTLLARSAKWHLSCKVKFNATKLRRAEKRLSSSPSTDTDELPTKRFTRLNTDQPRSSKDICFFCEQPGSEKSRLHEVSTFQVDSRVRTCALKLQDEHLIAKLSTGDLVAQEAKYHGKCLANLYNKIQSSENNDNYEDDVDVTNTSKGLVLAELIAYMEDSRRDEEIAPVFKLSDMCKLYDERLSELGAGRGSKVHSTDLKNRLLAYLPNLTAYKSGREVFLAFNDDVGHALKKACLEKKDEEAVYLSKAANIVRRDMLSHKNLFTGSFEKDCLEQAVPKSLSAIVSMIIYGTNIKDQSQSSKASEAVSTLSQLLLFNSAQKNSAATQMHHNRDRETPLAIYTRLLIHAKTRKRHLIDKIFQLGLSVSYDRVLSITTALCNKVCHRYNEEDLVCPENLLEGLFVTAAVDNIDHNLSSSTATESFHGTDISLFQHRSSYEDGNPRTSNIDTRALQSSKKEELLELPRS